MTGFTLIVDDYALAALPTLDRDLAQAGAWVMRSFKGLPNPALLRRFPGAAVIGGADRYGLLARLEAATTTLSAPVIAVLPKGCAPSPELRGPGVVDLLPAGEPNAAERILLMARVPIVSSTRSGARNAAGAAPRPQQRPSTPQAGPALAPLAAAVPGSPTGPPTGSRAALPSPDPEAELLAIASSTGCVWVLAALLRDLRPRDRAVCVAQHLEGEFVPFFAEWLQGVSGWPTIVVDEPLPYAPGVVYVPTGGMDLVVERGRVTTAPACSRYVPNGDRLLRTAASALGPRAMGLVLSGMGCDGADGLAELARCGGRALCQEPASAVVPSMPETALRKTPGAASAPPERLAASIGTAAVRVSC
ncbi:MAG TPA: CheB methylesterase domain-containing protein [Anaeromyxobacteraceae bacterium]|nr:CheB methylesterase domain-containing protein [Anaeromyxobacteraceae bacterium]